MEIVNKIENKKISEIKPYIRNARNNEKTIELLCKIIPQVGFNVPIVIDENGIIVKGHARYVAAIRLGMTEVPCVVTHASPEDVKLDRIADNVVSEFSEWLTEDLLSELKNMDFDFDMSELNLPSFRDISVDINTEVYDATQKQPEHDASSEQNDDFKEGKIYYIAKCPRCGERNVVEVDS